MRIAVPFPPSSRRHGPYMCLPSIISSRTAVSGRTKPESTKMRKATLVAPVSLTSPSAAPRKAARSSRHPRMPFCVPRRRKHGSGSAQLSTAAHGIRPPGMPCAERNAESLPWEAGGSPQFILVRCTGRRDGSRRPRRAGVGPGRHWRGVVGPIRKATGTTPPRQRRHDGPTQPVLADGKGLCGKGAQREEGTRMRAQLILCG